ncbi:hypothetical protein NSU_0453 [Novosphingobium pentaromativorans US6-1]|uniref:Uncharacterized protein n=1 Tax=Novosphingobium pentaromativorans US6-1 TaxID=1088721 RepID=G6E7Y2_9SPHN|nr:hypothetical protein NSU_0453 [Novosphingobium pentaromativorans US6-1]
MRVTYVRRPMHLTRVETIVFLPAATPSHGILRIADQGRSNHSDN